MFLKLRQDSESLYTFNIQFLFSLSPIKKKLMIKDVLFQQGNATDWMLMILILSSF